MMNKLKWILYIIILAFLVFWIVICAKYKMIEIIGSSECIPTYDLSEVETNEQIYSLQVGESLQGISQELSTALISDHLVTQTEDEVLIANKAGEFITDSIHVYIDKDNSGSLITFDGVVTYLDECEKLYSINDNEWVYILKMETVSVCSRATIQQYRRLPSHHISPHSVLLIRAQPGCIW